MSKGKGPPEDPATNLSKINMAALRPRFAQIWPRFFFLPSKAQMRSKKGVFTRVQ